MFFKINQYDLKHHNPFICNKILLSVHGSLSETSLMHEIIYCFQGIEGKILRKEPGGLGFTIDLKISKTMSPIQKGLVERLANVGFLHNQIKQHCDEPDRHIGLIGQSLVSILTDELTSYYHLVSLLQAQVCFYNFFVLSL